MEENNTVTKEQFDDLSTKFSQLMEVVSNLTQQIQQQEPQPIPKDPPKEPEISGDEAFIAWMNNN